MLLLSNHWRVTKRRQSLHFDTSCYLIELLFFSNENLRNVVLSQVEVAYSNAFDSPAILGPSGSRFVPFRPRLLAGLAFLLLSPEHTR